MKLFYHKRYQKSFTKLPDKIKQKALIVLDMFYDSPTHPLLRNHALSGDYEGLRSIDVTGDYRIILRQISDKTYELVELIDVGTHAQLYK